MPFCGPCISASFLCCFGVAFPCRRMFWNFMKLPVPTTNGSLQPCQVPLKWRHNLHAAKPPTHISHVSLWPVTGFMKDACWDHFQRFFQNLHGPQVRTCAGKLCTFTCSSNVPKSAGSNTSPSSSDEPDEAPDEAPEEAERHAADAASGVAGGDSSES